MWVTILQAIDMLTCLPQSLRDPLHNLQLCWTLSHKAHKALNSHTTVSVTTKILIRKAKPKFLKSVWLACEKKSILLFQDKYKTWARSGKICDRL